MKPNTIINRTPHRIDILALDGVTPITTFPAAPRDGVARVEVTSRSGVTLFATEAGEVTVVEQAWGTIVGLPPPAKGVAHIVSAIVAAAAIAQGRGAWDLFVPGDQVRDNAGRIVGCRGLVMGDQSMPHLAIGAEVWVTYTADQLRALGVADDVLEEVTKRHGWQWRDREITSDDRSAYDRARALYRSHFDHFVTPVVFWRDYLDLVEALLVRPHRSAVAASLA